MVVGGDVRPWAVRGFRERGRRDGGGGVVIGGGGGW